MDIALLIIGIILILLTAAVLAKLGGMAKNSGTNDNTKLLDEIKTSNAASQRELREELNSNVQTSIRNLGELLSSSQRTAGENQAAKITDMSTQINQRLSDMDRFLSEKQQASGNAINDQLKTLENRFKTLEANNEMKLDAMRATMTKHLTGIQEENTKKLDAIQSTVNEKLESKMNESFKLVGERLEQVYKGLGEMQSIAAGVGDLKKVLSNVKNRGILGEIQLGAILEEILAPEQYEKDIATIPKSANRVEFAVKLPGNGDSCIYLPIDSKFPGDTFAALQDAYDSGNPDAVAAAKKNLQTVVKKCAKDIREKYVEPPYTTNFGIMFLPFEGLYSEVVNSGLIEVLQRDYNVNVAGPSTMAAMLNSLQMGFQTLAIQKKSSQVWEVLGAVKSEFLTFSKALEDAQKHIKKVDDDLEKLVGVRTRQINRKLSSVEVLDTVSLEEE
ncbi:MAG: DNA recombination protein RmuC [Ruminococcus sp.]|nr:DNA recombination protein RmuC [Ruminococcus sp.]